MHSSAWEDLFPGELRNTSWWLRQCFERRHPFLFSSMAHMYESWSWSRPFFVQGSGYVDMLSSIAGRNPFPWQKSFPGDLPMDTNPFPFFSTWTLKLRQTFLYPEWRSSWLSLKHQKLGFILRDVVLCLRNLESSSWMCLGRRTRFLVLCKMVRQFYHFENGHKRYSNPQVKNTCNWSHHHAAHNHR